MITCSGRALLAAFTAVLFWPALHGQPATFRGEIPGGGGEAVRLMAVDDYITNRQVIIAQGVTDTAGRFECSAELDRTTPLSLDIGHYTFSFVAERGGSYVIRCDSVDLENQFRPYYNREPLPASVVSEPPPGLNGLVLSFTREYNEFVMDHFSGIYQRRNAALIGSFREDMEAKYGGYGHPFLDAAIEYRLAGTELAVSAARRSDLFNDHLRDRPVQLHHPDYMEFFNGFFDKYLYPDNRSVPRRDLYAVINQRAGLGALLDTLGKDTTLRNEVIRELVCLKTLGQLYRTQDFSKTNILMLLADMKAGSKFPDHRKIAENLIGELTFMQMGYPSPEFRLSDLEGQMYSRDDFRGSPLYISFVTTWSNACLQELELLKGVFDEYKGRVNFVSIFFDREPDIVRSLVREKGYGWTILFNDSGFETVNKFKLKTFPVFILLDGEGNVVESPAYKPSEVIRESFDRLLEKQ